MRAYLSMGVSGSMLRCCRLNRCCAGEMCGIGSWRRVKAGRLTCRPAGPAPAFVAGSLDLQLLSLAFPFLPPSITDTEQHTVSRSSQSHCACSTVRRAPAHAVWVRVIEVEALPRRVRHQLCACCDRGRPDTWLLLSPISRTSRSRTLPEYHCRALHTGSRRSRCC